MLLCTRRGRPNTPFAPRFLPRFWANDPQGDAERCRNPWIGAGEGATARGPVFRQLTLERKPAPSAGARPEGPGFIEPRTRRSFRGSPCGSRVPVRSGQGHACRWRGPAGLPRRVQTKGSFRHRRRGGKGRGWTPSVLVVSLAVQTVSARAGRSVSSGSGLTGGWKVAQGLTRRCCSKLQTHGSVSPLVQGPCPLGLDFLFLGFILLKMYVQPRCL